MVNRRFEGAALALLVIAPAALSQPPVDYDELRREYAAAIGDADDTVAVSRRFTTRFAAAAEQAAGTDAAIPFLAWIVENAMSERSAIEAAMTEIATSHAKSTEIEPVLARLPHLESLVGREKVVAWLDRLAAESAHPELEARALFERARLVLGRVADDVTEEQRAAALGWLDDATKLAKDPSLAAAIKDFDRSPRGLAVGDVAPEIAGLDVNGTPFRALRLPRQGRGARLLGRLVRPLPGDVPPRAVAREAHEGPTLRPARRQQ